MHAHLAMFATSMAISEGVKSPLDGSVYSASAAALLLAFAAPHVAARGQENRDTLAA